MILNLLLIVSFIILIGLGVKRFSKKSSPSSIQNKLYSRLYIKKSSTTNIKSNFLYYWNLFKNDLILLGIFIFSWYGWEQLMSFLYSNQKPEDIDLAPLYSFEDISLIFFGLYAAFLIIRFSIIFVQIINNPIAEYLEKGLGLDFVKLTPWQKIITVLILICLFALVASLSMLAI